ncbi:MAG: YdeI/OmpD-associated family protein [Candidatus Zixiibacteriota bacterium]
MKALRSNPQALATFKGFSPSHKREYVEWITEAKREETRSRRIETALSWLAEGKTREWKYAKKT